jgi:hypothetical protein
MTYHENDPKIKELRMKLAEKGIFAMYGGRKGHGFWLYQIGERLAKELTLEFRPDRFWNICDAIEETPVIKNDGKRSGNTCFWMFSDAKKLAELPL